MTSHSSHEHELKIVDVKPLLLAALDDFDEETRDSAQLLIENLGETHLQALQATFDSTSNLSEAYTGLGLAGGHGAAGGDPEEEGKRLFNRLKLDVGKVICENKAVRAYYSRPGLNNFGVATALVFGALSGSIVADINLMLLSWIVAHGGIQELCGRRWKP